VTRSARPLLALAVAAALAAAACTSPEAGTFAREGKPSGPVLPPGPSATPATPTADPLDFSDCTGVIKPQIQDQPGGDRDLRFGCGRMRVPLDYTQPDGESIELFVLRVRYGQQRDRIGSLLVNPGGPGGSGLDAAVGLGLSLPVGLLGRFDLVGFDPRGVGLSTPVECIPDELKDRGTALDPDARTEEDYQEQVELAREIAESCSEEYGDTLEHYNTEETARDIDLVRQAVGDDELTYLGYSYGTRLGSVYAHLFPDRVRALVLDGAVNPVEDDLASSEAQARGFENAYDQFAADCRRRGAACPIGPDARRSLAALLDQARGSPIPSRKSGEEREATAGHVLLAAISALYDQEDWPELATALADARRGDAAGVFTLADRYNQRDSDGDYTNILDANIAINCADSDDRISDDTVREKLVAWRRNYPLFGSSLALGLLGCQQWLAPRHPLPEVRADGAPPILVIGTRHDPATPYASAQVLARQLDSGVLLTWEGDGHTAYPKTPCITRAVGAYLTDLRLPRDGASCPGS
jgi:pimeloyl-ACP methyl ester carboxylesterase